MLKAAPQVTKTELKRILEALSSDGVAMPIPEKVEVIADEDFEGDPIFRLKVVFPATVAVEAASWKVISPLLMKLVRLVSEKSGYERPVVDDVVRLSEVSAG